MVRNYKRKRIAINEEDANRAVNEVIDGKGLRETASSYGLKVSTLFYRVQSHKLRNVAQTDDCVRVRDYSDYSSLQSTSQVFSRTEEDLLVEYILKCSRIHYGMTYLQIRVLAYDYAKKLDKDICTTKWDTKKIAGVDWLQGFMKRNPTLSLRKPENTSLSRASSFTKHNIAEFFQNYERALKSKEFTPDRIYNLDETGVSTVLQSPNVVALKGSKQVGQIVSAERGTSITMCGIINAIGNVIPPVFIFPRARFRDNMLDGAPTGSLGLANSPNSGWMTKELFLKVLEHIVKFTKCSQQNPLLVLMDNHETHCSLNAVVYAKEHGIVLVTFPPHTSHRLQPLDVTVYSPFKTKLAQAMNNWMVTNPGRTITIHDLARLINTAYENSFTIKNITEGFRRTGLWPLNTLIFSDGDFDASYVTDRPQPSTSQIYDKPPSPMSNRSDFEQIDDRVEFDSTEQCLTPKQLETHAPITPEVVRPYPKALPRKNKITRKKVKSRILTETPEKNKIEEETLARENRKKQTEERRARARASKVTKNFARTEMFRKNVETSSEESEEEIIFDDSTDTEVFSDEQDMDDIDEISGANPLKIQDYVFVEFRTKKSIRYYVGQICENIDGDDYEVNFMKKQAEGMKFCFPQTSDISRVRAADIVLKLPPPHTSGTTARTTQVFSFPFNFGGYNIN